MKHFKDYILEADYSRFLKKNKHLSDDQKNKINIFFKSDKKAVQQFEKKWGWQSKHPKEMKWHDFENIMMKYKSGRRKNLKSINIPGKKGEDYWPVKLKTKGFIANIPLNHKTANYMNSCKYGTIDVNYCIGWGDDAEYWDSHVIDDQELPVYIIDGDRKWVVIIDDGNHSYQVWDKLNQRDISKSNKEPIPGFSIKKELLNSRMKKVYDEIREDFYNTSNISTEEAINSYNEIVSDIRVYAVSLYEDEQYYYENMETVKDNTYDNYINLADEAEGIAEEQSGSAPPIFIEKVELIKNILKIHPNGTDVDSNGDPIWIIRRVKYNKKELEAFIDVYEKEINKPSKEPDYTTRDHFIKLANIINDMSVWDMIEYDMNGDDEIEWDEDVYEYEGCYDCYQPDPHNSAYEPYFDFLVGNNIDVDMDYVFSDMYELSDGGSWDVNDEDIKDWMSINDMPHPDDIGE